MQQSEKLCFAIDLATKFALELAHREDGRSSSEMTLDSLYSNALSNACTFAYPERGSRATIDALFVLPFTSAVMSTTYL